MKKNQLSAPYGVMGKPAEKKGLIYPNRPPIEKMDDDQLIFWMLFTRDGITAMRNADCERLKEAIRGEEQEYEKLVNAVKDRMRKGGKAH